MKLLPLSRGLYTIIDDDDFEILSKFKWSASAEPYAFRTDYTEEFARLNFL